jgi:hypothetical protein
MARIALRGESVENSRGELRVALIALHSRVGAKKREAVLVVLHLLYSNVPALHGMALRAVRTHLAAVNIGMAIGAVFPDVAENRFGVALHAFHFFVHTAQGIAGFVVIELWNGSNGAPAGSGVAVFAGNTQRAVGISRGLFLRRVRRMGGRGRHSHRTAGEGKCK